MRCVVFELAGGGTYVPPPGRAKVAQTPGRARVKDLFCREILQIFDLDISFCRGILWILDLDDLFLP